MTQPAQESLSEYRDQIDAIDSEILELIGDRNDVCAAIQSVKLSADIPIWDQTRVDEVIDHYVEELGEVDGTAIASAIIGTQEQLEKLAGINNED